jgi:hypothetical protein
VAVSNITDWSVPDEGSPGGRRLEHMPWNQTPDGEGCRQQYTQTATNAFRVSIKCELERQSELQQEFATREDKYPYMDRSDCKGKVEPLVGWEKLPIDFWKSNQQQPVAWCIIDAGDGRRDRRPIREENWHTAQQCKDDPRPLDILVNGRGVRGCKFPN